MKAEKDSPENHLLKYQELYVLSKEIFQEELNRSANIEQKASIYISILTFLLGLLGFFGKQIVTTFLPPQGILSWMLMILIGTLLFLSLRTWFLLFRIVRVYDYKKMPIPLEFFHEHDLKTVYFGMAKGLEENLSINRENTNRKTESLDKAYRLLRAIVIIVAITFLTFTLKAWTDNTTKQPNKEKIMPDDPKEETSSPDTDVVPPTFVTVSNSNNDIGDTRPEQAPEKKEE